MTIATGKSRRGRGRRMLLLRAGSVRRFKLRAAAADRGLDGVFLHSIKRVLQVPPRVELRGFADASGGLLLRVYAALFVHSIQVQVQRFR